MTREKISELITWFKVYTVDCKHIVLDKPTSILANYTSELLIKDILAFRLFPVSDVKIFVSIYDG